ncbi:MAG: MOSC domain-containing protein [Arenimonas sp.]|nr:MOSC domain-containing protein [Rhizobium sp.]MBW8448342.1 MOSC domain-containing protein [Arenimonas sp.]
MKILAVCRGSAEILPGKKYKTGINKVPVNGPVMVDAQGIVGDAICNGDLHGGAEQAIYIEGALTLDWWAGELGHPVEPGTFGENLVMEGIDNRDIAVGDRFIAGDVVLEVTSTRIPCATFAAKMNDPKFPRRYMKAGRAGAYARVLSDGILEVGQAVDHRPFAGERITMPELMASYGKKLQGTERDRYLSVPLHAELKAFLKG